MAHKQSKQGKQSVSFRFDPITVRRLKDHAADAGAGQTALAERYIDEGIRQDEHPLIYFREGAVGRRPALLGSRLDVAEVTIRQNNGSVDEAASYLEVPVEQLEAVARYDGEYTDAIHRFTHTDMPIVTGERVNGENHWLEAVLGGGVAQ